MPSRLQGRLRKRRRGFTIAEVMFAAGVMALTITTSITTMQSAFLALDSARNITLAGQTILTGGGTAPAFP